MYNLINRQIRINKRNIGIKMRAKRVCEILIRENFCEIYIAW